MRCLHQSGKYEFFHDCVWRRRIVIGASCEYGDQVVGSRNVNFLAPVSLRSNHDDLPGAAGRSHVKHMAPPEVSVADVLNVAVFGRGSVGP